MDTDYLLRKVKTVGNCTIRLRRYCFGYPVLHLKKKNLAIVTPDPDTSTKIRYIDKLAR